MTFDIGTGARVIATTGEAVTAYHLTPEREDLILQTIDGHRGKATTGQVAAALGRNIPDASRLLQELADRGKLLGLPGGMGRLEWSRRTVNLDMSLVRQAHVSRIREYLLGRRELPGAIATALRLPRNEVEATCTWMMLHGQLVGTPIGASMVYALEARVTARVDVRLATSIPMSPEARFRAELAKLGPEKPIQLRPVPRPVKPPVKKPLKDPVKAKATPKPKATSKPKAAKVKKVAPAVRPPSRRQIEAAAVRQRREERQRKRDEAAALKDARQRRRQEAAAARREIMRARQAQADAQRVQREARKAAEAQARLASTPASDEKPLVTWANEIGVPPVTLRKWLTNHPAYRAQCRTPGKVMLVPARAVQAYQAAATPKGATWSTTIPDDTLTIREACKLLGWGYSKVYRGLIDGKLTAVQARGKLRFPRVALEAFKAALDEEARVPDGWVNLQALARELGTDERGATDWLRRRNTEFRKQRNANRQVALFVPQAAADAYRAHRLAHPTDAPASLPSPDPEPQPAPAQRTVITTEIDRQLRAELPPERRRIPGETARVAARHGLSVSQVRYHLRFTPITKETAHD